MSSTQRIVDMSYKEGKGGKGERGKGGTDGRRFFTLLYWCIKNNIKNYNGISNGSTGTASSRSGSVCRGESTAGSAVDRARVTGGNVV